MEFRVIPGYEKYEININGLIRNRYSGKIIKSRINKKGYLRVGLMSNKKQYQLSVHRLIAITWMRNPGNHPFVLHRNDNKLDNRIDNLYWGTRSDNGKDRSRNGLWSPIYGERHVGAKLSNGDVYEIRKTFNNQYGQLSELSRKFNVTPTQIQNIVEYRSRRDG